MIVYRSVRRWLLCAPIRPFDDLRSLPESCPSTGRTIPALSSHLQQFGLYTKCPPSTGPGRAGWLGPAPIPGTTTPGRPVASQLRTVSLYQELLDCVAERIVIVARNHMRRTSDVAELRMGNQFPEFSGAFGRNKVARSTTH